VHLKPSTQPPQAQSGQGQQELQVASGTASPKALGYVGDACAAGGCCAGFECARCLCMGLWRRAGLTVRHSTRCYTVTPPRKEGLLTCGKKKQSCHGSHTSSDTTTGCGTTRGNHPTVQTTRPMSPPQPQPPHRVSWSVSYASAGLCGCARPCSRCLSNGNVP
jgi:hypothetical protein